MSEQPASVPTVHAVGKYFPSLPPWDTAKAVQVLMVSFLAYNLALGAVMVFGCVLFTLGFLFGLVPDRYELIP